jgi:signal transduction histidine kinase
MRITIMKENDENISADERMEASPSRQRFVGLIDVVIVFAVLASINIYHWPFAVYRFFVTINSIVLFVSCLIVYRLICLLFFNATIGMKSLRVVLLNGEMEKLTIKEKILAAFFVLYRGVSYYNK